jgi:hypothetical protein
MTPVPNFPLRIYLKCRHSIGVFYRFLFRLYARFFLSCSKFILKSQRGNLTLAFNNIAGIDGTGAQIQRLLSVRCLADYLDCDYQHSPILTVSVHPLDPFQSEKELELYLVELNKTFFMPSGSKSFTDEIKYSFITVSSFELFRISMQIFFFRKNVFLQVLETYPATDSNPKILKRVSELSQSFYNSKIFASAPRYDVVIHYRQGVGGFAVYPGQALSRQLPLDYFIQIVHQIQGATPSRILKICVLTDAPTTNISYKILDSQTENWENTPNFENGEMKISGLSFSELIEIPGIEVDIQIGGNPLDALAIMSKAEQLLIGRSSLSYVGALLNSGGKVYFPKSFWHPPMEEWEVCH